MMTTTISHQSHVVFNGKNFLTVINTFIRRRQKIPVTVTIFHI